SGDFGFEQVTLNDGVTKVVRIVADNVELGLGDGTTDYVRLTDGSAFIVILPAEGSRTAGLAARIEGTIAIDLPVPVGLSGDFVLEINTTNERVEETFAFGPDPEDELELGLDPGLRVAASNVVFTIAGQTLRANLAFEQRTLASGARSVTLGVTEGELSLAGVVRLSEIEGVFAITPGGFAGRLSADIEIDLDPAISFDGTVSIAINNGSAAVRQTIVVDGAEEVLDLPGGPYLRVEIGPSTGNTTAILNVLGLQITGNFVIEKTTTASGASIVRIGLSGVGIDLGGVVTVSNGQGVFLLLPGDAGLGITAATGTNLTIGTHTLVAGTQVRYVKYGSGAAISGLSNGSTYFVKSATSTTVALALTADGPAITVSLTAVAGTTHTLQGVGGARIGSPIAGTGGIAGSISASVEFDVPGVSFGGAFALKINTTSSSVDDSVTVNNVPLRVQLPAGPYLRVEGTGVNLTVAGVTLSGNFAFEQQSGDTVILVSNARLALGGNALEIFDGRGVILVKTGGIAAKLSVSVRANFGSAVQLGGTIGVEINQTGLTFDSSPETFTLGGESFVIDFAQT
ncbi:MAG TPA: hypothetical protein VGK49_08985, partial [Ilumatobacteraceae bacterium]